MESVEIPSRILLICNSSHNVVNFRGELIRFLVRAGLIVSVICGDSKRESDIQKLGVKAVCVIPFSNRGTNPFSLKKLSRAFSAAIQTIRPDIVFTFQAKPNIIGANAAAKCGVSRVFSMIEGLGDPFQPNGIKGKVVRFLISKMYRKALAKVEKVFFLNLDDVSEFVSRKIVPKEKAIVIPGIGIDVKEINDKGLSTPPKRKSVLMLSRLTANKGIYDFCQIARLVRQVRPDIIFELYGEEQDITSQDLQPYVKAGDIVYRGFSEDPITVISQATVYVSTSCYREGFPRTLLEAMALKKPILATNTVGSKDAIVDGVTGYLLEMHDIDAFCRKILALIDDSALQDRLGSAAYEYCLKNFDSKIINQTILEAITSPKTS